jgi:hypothetical protein
VPWDIRLWVETPHAVRRSRIAARDPVELMRRWESDWWPSEEEYVQAQDPAARADVIVISNVP